MKVMTIGLSPFLMTSRSKIHSLILRYLYLTGHSMAGIVWGHSPQYFVPEDNEDGSQSFYYDFEYSNQKFKIPIIPFDRGQRESIEIYETINKFEPDVVITVGDLSDFVYMHAVKSFLPKPIKWLAILLGYNFPLREDLQMLLNDIDGILCTSDFCYQQIQKLYNSDSIDVHYVGCNPEIYKLTEPENIGFRIMAVPKTTQVDCAPTIIKAVCEMTDDIPDLKLYLHANIHDPGDHNLEDLKKLVDTEGIVSFPDKYVSLLDGISEVDMSVEFSKSDVFISIPMISGSSMSVFQSMACGCYPLLSDCGSNKDIARLLSDFMGEKFKEGDFLIPSIELMAAGDTHLYVCSKTELKKKIDSAYRKIKKYKGLRKQFSEFTLKYSQGSFLEKVAEIATVVSESNIKICLENV